MQGLENVRMVAVGAFHNLALVEPGIVWAWGNNEYGQLGTGDTQPHSSPVSVKGLCDLILVFYPWFSSSYVIAAYCLEIALISSPSFLQPHPVLISFHTLLYLQPVSGTLKGRWWVATQVDLAAGGWHSMALTADGEVDATTSVSTELIALLLEDHIYILVWLGVNSEEHSFLGM